jgi:hypothetical protein
MSKRTELLGQALDEDRQQRHQIAELQSQLWDAKNEVAERIRAGDFIRYQRLQSILIGEDYDS